MLGALTCLTSPLTAPHAGEIYKSVDAQGHVVYSDHADSGAQRTRMMRAEKKRTKTC